MAIIKPFKGLRYNQEKFLDLSSVICPPYDVVSQEEYNKLIKKSPYNLINLELPQSTKEPYKKAHDLFDEWKEKSILKKDLNNSIYIYEEEFLLKNEIKKIKGFICNVKLEEFSKQVILPHEETLSKAKDDRFNLLKETSCNFSQIYSLYIDDEKRTKVDIDKLSQGKPDIETKSDDGIIHRLWIIDNKNVIEKITNDFKDRKLYIADGHHRYETALKYSKTSSLESSNYVMMMLMDMENDGLAILPTHRIIKNLHNFDPNTLIEQCKTYFDIVYWDNIDTLESKLYSYYLENKKAFAFCYDSTKACIMVLRSTDIMDELLPKKSAAARDLDVTVLHELILKNFLGIDNENMKNQTNLSYTRCINVAIDSLKDDDVNCSFILNPTKISQIKNIALAGEKMPQKSTYFYPKLITGLVMNDLNE